MDSLKVIKSGNVSISRLLESTEDIQYFLAKENQIIVYCVSGENENIFYKISPKGTITDSLAIHCRPTHIAFIKGFIINKEKHQFYNWSFDGNRQAISIIAQNEQFDWNLGKQQQLLSNISKSASAVYVAYDSDSPAPTKSPKEGIQTIPSMRTYAILTYFSNGQCFQFFTTLNVDEQFPYSYTQELLLNNLFKRVNTKVKGDIEIIKTDNIHYRYFQKLKREKVRFSGGGGNTPGFDVMLYHGNLYTDVVFRSDTLRLKEFMYLDEKWHSSDIEIEGKNLGVVTKNKGQPPHIIQAYMYYANPELAYALFTNNDKKLYLIKSINSSNE
ncbi:hypothetical protein [Pedobacter agri]|uniref:hypothetical protein n=1 Tax=Pedobacter agri TaxID=454586 RepID=UPI00292F509F|nr:hypothetical protein [Pedobacter agri]